MVQLFGVGEPAISKHLAHISEEKGLYRDTTVSKMEITTQHGAIEGKMQRNEIAFYSLDAIIAVGYRVSSALATEFRSFPILTRKSNISKERIGSSPFHSFPIGNWLTTLR